MPREKKYTKTVAVRLTTEEWELLEHGIIRDGRKNATDWFRALLDPVFSDLYAHRYEAAKKAEAAAKRAAKKAEANVNA